CRLGCRTEADGPPSESLANEERGGDERDECSPCRSADAKSRDSETVSERRCRKNCGRDPARVPSRQRDADREIAPTTELGPGSMRVADRGPRGQAGPVDDEAVLRDDERIGKARNGRTDDDGTGHSSRCDEADRYRARSRFDATCDGPSRGFDAHVGRKLPLEAASISLHEQTPHRRI